MHNSHTIYKGAYLALATAFISGFAVFFNKFSISFWDNSSVFTTAKNLVTVLLLVSLILFLKKIPELKKLSKKQWAQLVLIGFIGGSIPFLLFFKGLSLTAAANAAFIHKTLFIWVALMAVPFLKEKISGLQFLALGILFAGVYLFVSPKQFHFGYGEVLALLATFFWAVENVIAKKVLRNILPLILAWGRMFFGSIFLLIYLLYTGNFGALFSGVSFESLAWLFLSGFVLLGYVTTWYSALKYASATVVSSVLVLGAPITAVLNSLFITHQFNQEFLPIILIILGVLLFTKLLQYYVRWAFDKRKIFFPA